MLAIAAVIMAHQVTISLLNPAQLFRYMAGAMFIGMLFLPIVVARRPRRADEPALPHGIPGSGNNGTAVSGENDLAR